MKIAVLLSDLSTASGGLYYSVPALTNATLLASGDSKVTVWVCDEPAEVDKERWPFALIQGFPACGPSGYRYAPGMERSLVKAAPDIIHSHGIWMNPTRVSYAHQRKHGCPWVVSPRGMLESWALRNSAWKKKLVGVLIENRALRAASCLHALHPGEADDFRKWGYRGPVAVIPNGVELPTEQPLRRKITENTLTVLFLSRLHPKKGVLELIEAFAHLHRDVNKGRRLRLVIAGTGDKGYVRACKEAAEALPAGVISFCGHILGEKKNKLFRDADVFILPSHSEGLPMAVLEAWSFGLPALLTSGCNFSEGFERRAALKITPDVYSIREGLLQAVNWSDEERKERGQAALQLASEYSWEEQGRRMAELYRWLVTGGEVPPFVQRDEKF